MTRQSSPAVDAAIAAYYEMSPEEDRLTRGASLLEAVRTRDLLLRHVPAPPATILDVGGGAGAYSLWLAERGYTVHLIDAAPRLVAEAQRRATGNRALASCTVGDARALDFTDAFADVVLLLGPLYHLTDASDRARALAEATRVLKPGGWFVGAVISRWASALDGLARDLFRDPRFRDIVTRDLDEGQHRNPTENLDYFTTAYLHRPDEALDEVRAAGLDAPRIFAIEGPAWLLPDVHERITDPRRAKELLDLLPLLEAEPSLLGVSAHLLLVARKAL